jgi:hypothetical protein
MSVDTRETTAAYARRSVIHAGATRSITGSDLVPGDVIATGVILEVSRDDVEREVRLEMPGADVHFVGYDEPVSVLATVTREVLDGISLGTFVARASLRSVRTVVEPDSAPEPEADVLVVQPADAPPARTGRSNPGPVGQYDEGVEHFTDLCPIHGETTFALHKAGRSRSGEQRYNRRCLLCHTDYNLDHRG